MVANLLPSALQDLWQESPRIAPHLQRALRRGWGAVMLYLVIRDHGDLPPHGLHVQAVSDPSQPMFKGNHLLCSLASIFGASAILVCDVRNSALHVDLLLIIVHF